MNTMETIFSTIDKEIQKDQNYLAQLPKVIEALTLSDYHQLRQAVSMATMKGIDNFRSDVILPEAVVLLIVAIVQSLVTKPDMQVLELDAGIGSISLGLLEIMPELQIAYMESEPQLQAIFEATAKKLQQHVQAVELDEQTQTYELIIQNVDMETAAKNWQQLALEYEQLLPELLTASGRFVLILPQVVLNEEIFAPLRQRLFASFHLQAYIQLPNAFFIADDLVKGILVLESQARPQHHEPVVLQLPDPQHQQQFARSVRDLLMLLEKQK